MSRISRVSLLSAAIGAWLVLLCVPMATQASGCTSGQLIKGSNPSVYYCGADGKRYVFPNLKTYQTWYADFSNVTTISDASLGTIAIGGNVTYKPGVRMVKIMSDPTVYVVDAGGLLRAIASESVATQLYGSAWNTKIDDLPDAFFVNYHVGPQIASSSQITLSQVTAAAGSINTDRGLGGASTTSSGVTLSLSPNLTALASGQSTVVSVTVNDAKGISTASVFLNGEPLKLCAQSGFPTSATCSVTLYGGDYADGTTLSLYGQEVNRTGDRIVTSTKSLRTSGGGTTAAGSVSLSFSPATTTLNAGQSTTVTVTANDPAGVASVSVFVNGTLAQRCAQSGLKTSATCSTTVYGTNYPSGSTVAIYGQEISKDGVPTISATTNLSVAVGSSTSGYVTLGFSPAGTTLKTDADTVVTAQGYAPLGVTNLSVYVNGSRIKSCDTSGANAHTTCAATIDGSSYASGTAISVYAQGTDTAGVNFISPTSTISILAGENGVNGNVSLSFSPYATTLATGQSTTVTVHAQGSGDLTSIRIYVNDALAHTCTLSGTSSTGTCSVSLSGSNYAQGSTISVYGEADEAGGGSSVSPTSTLTVTSTDAGGGSVSLFVSPSVTSLSGTQTATVTVNAYDPSGLGSVDIYVNGLDVHSCAQSGSWPTGASCSYTLSAANYSHGTTLNIYGRGVNIAATATNSTTTVITVN